MLPQEEIIEKLRKVCQQDERLTAAMLYGSFTKGEGDQFSDVDICLFFEDEALEKIDPRQWVSQIAPVELYYINQYGNHGVIFSNLIRAEFHFDPISEAYKIESWKGNAWFPTLESALILDRTGQLTPHLQTLVGAPPAQDTPQAVQFLSDSFFNWLLFGSNVLARGEIARSLEILQLVHNYLLRMIRLQEGATDHWIAPTKVLEKDISPEAYSRFVKCTARLDKTELWQAYLSDWEWGCEMLADLANHHNLTLPHSLIEKLDRRLKEFSGL